MQQNTKMHKLQTTNNFVVVMTMAIPIIIQGLVLILQTLVDKAFLGNINTNYLSAVGISQAPFIATADALMAICTGITIVVSQKNGANKRKEINESANASIAFNSLISWFLFILWFVFPEAIFTLLKVDASLLQYCIDYVRILSLYFIFYGVDVSLETTLLGMGKTKPIMYVGLLKVLLNIFLDWVMIFGKLGFPALYIKGAALATTISNVVGTIVLIIYVLISEELSANLKLKEILRFRWSKYREILQLGLPTGLEYFLWNASNLVLVRLLNQQDIISIAIFTVTFAIELIVYMIFNGIARASLTLVGHRIGANDKQGAKKLMSSVIRYNMVIVSIFLVIFIVLPKPILDIFTNDTSLIDMAVFYLILRAITMFPKSLNVVVGSGIRALGDVKWMLRTQIFGSVFVVLCSYFLMYFLQLGVIAIYISLFLDELLRATLNTVRFYKGYVFRSTKREISLNKDRLVGWLLTSTLHNN